MFLHIIAHILKIELSSITLIGPGKSLADHSQCFKCYHTFTRCAI
ncbi:hypothetical protein Gotur_005063 [Gossypium turneri]